MFGHILLNADGKRLTDVTAPTGARTHERIPPGQATPLFFRRGKDR